MIFGYTFVFNKHAYYRQQYRLKRLGKIRFCIFKNIFIILANK